MELKEILAGKTPEQQTEWLRTHMHNWDEFMQQRFLGENLDARSRVQ